MDFKKLHGMLRKGIVDITFQSLLSDKTHTRKYTLVNETVNQSDQSDRILVRDAQTGEFEDILLTSIIGTHCD